MYKVQYKGLKVSAGICGATLANFLLFLYIKN